MLCTCVGGWACESAFGGRLGAMGVSGGWVLASLGFFYVRVLGLGLSSLMH